MAKGSEYQVWGIDSTGHKSKQMPLDTVMVAVNDNHCQYNTPTLWWTTSTGQANISFSVTIVSIVYIVVLLDTRTQSQ